MKLRYAAAILFPAFLFNVNSARADDNFVYGAVGQGVELGFGRVINDSINVRADFGRDSSGTFQHSLGGNQYDIKPETTNHVNALVDWFPFTGSGFRLTGGLGYSNDQTANSIATPNGSGNYSINGNAYSATAVGQLKATSTFDRVTPQIGIGWDSARASTPGWRVMTGLNLSVLSGGSTTLAASNSGTNSALQADVAAEQGRVNSDVGGHQARLNVSVGVGYSF